MSSYVVWDAQFTLTSINASTIANNANLKTQTISSTNKEVTEVCIEVAYGGVATSGARVYIVRNVKGSDEVETDNPYGFELPFSVNKTYRRNVTIDALDMAEFKVLIVNASGGSITSTVSYRQAVHESS